MIDKNLRLSSKSIMKKYIQKEEKSFCDILRYKFTQSMKFETESFKIQIIYDIFYIKLLEPKTIRKKWIYKQKEQNFYKMKAIKSNKSLKIFIMVRFLHKK